MEPILLLSRERRARVWLDVAPPLSQIAVGPATRHERLVVSGTRLANHKTATIELFLPLGGRFMYGLLGCEALGDATSWLDVLLTTSNEKTNRFNESLAKDLDQVWCGLPDEYADAVLKGITAGVTSYGYPKAASLRISFAAHGEIGSAPKVFERIGKAVVALLLASPEETDDLPGTLERLLAA